MPVVNLIPEENKVDVMIPVQEKPKNVVKTQGVKKEENKTQDLNPKQNKSELYSKDQDQENQGPGLDIVNEIPDVVDRSTKVTPEADKKHIKIKEDVEEKEKGKSAFGSIFDWGDDDDDDDDDDDENDDDDDMPSSKHGHYKKKS